MVMRRRAMVRRGPGLVGAMARTAVVAGTAAATVGAVSSHQAKKAQAKQEEQAADQAAFESQQDVAELQQQMAAMQAQQAQAAIQAQQPAPATGTDLTAQLQQLGQLKASGVLSDEEFQAAKAKLLAG